MTERPAEPVDGGRGAPPDPEGMGDHPSGPSFLPGPPTPGRWPPDPPADGRRSAPLPPAGARGRGASASGGYQPPRRWLPGALTVAAVLLVGTVVAVSSLVAARDDREVARAPVRPAASTTPAPTPRTDRIEFSTAFGDGVLVVTGHTWAPTSASVHGQLLRVELELTCLTGQLQVSPANFQAFDARGQLFDIIEDDAARQPLAEAPVDAGQTVRGTVSFDLPRGEVTLLMSDGAQSVTAVKIPD
jgi:hypothetical protein